MKNFAVLFSVWMIVVFAACSGNQVKNAVII